MLNKIIYSLMKKILMSIGLCFCIMLSTNAVMAIGTNDGSTEANAIDHSVGSFHGFKVNLDGANTPITGHENTYYTWRVFTVSGGTSTLLTDFTKFQFVNYAPGGADFATKFPGGNLGTAGEYSAQSAHSIGVQWLDTPDAGVYAVEVEEYNGADATFCSARRRYFVSVTSGGVDFILAAINPEDNVVYTGAADQSLATCNSFSGNILANGLDATAKKAALGTTSVYYQISMKTGTQPWNGAWGFDYNLTNANGTDLAIEVLDAIGGGSAGTSDTGTGKITVNAGNPVAYLKVTFQNVLGTSTDADITFNLSEKNSGVTTGNTTAYITTASADQFETFNNVTGNKEATDFVIKASPDTQMIISVD